MLLVMNSESQYTCQCFVNIQANKQNFSCDKSFSAPLLQQCLQMNYCSQQQINV